MQPKGRKCGQRRKKQGADKFLPWFSSGTLAASCFCAASFVALQDANAGDSPLDTIMSTHFFADVPEAKDFVRDSRPPPGTLDYQPVTGPGREGPKLKSKDELKALESELEAAAAHNEEAARKRLGYKKPASAKSTKQGANQAISPAKR